MSWALDTTRIYVTEYQEVDKGIIARQHPLAGGTVHQYWGWEEPVLSVRAYVVGLTDKAAIRNMVRDSLTHYLYAPSGFETITCWVNQATFEALPAGKQSFAIGKECTDQVYVVNLELYREE